MVTGLKTQRQKNRRQKTTGRKRRRQRNPRGERPTIRFTPHAWSKLLFLRDCGSTEVSGFGITTGKDLLLVDDVRLVTQQCTASSVQFSDAAVQALFDRSSSDGRQDKGSGRIWIHTHPGICARPSDADEDTFARCCGAADWAVMFILAAGGDSYARLQFNLGPGCAKRLAVDVDYSGEFSPSNFAAWQSEYDAHVEVIDPLHTTIDRFDRVRRSHQPDFHTGPHDPHIRAAIASEWLAHCDAVLLFEDDDPGVLCEN